MVGGILLRKIKKRRTAMEKMTMSMQELSAKMRGGLSKAYELVETQGFPTIRVGEIILMPVGTYREWLLKNIINK